MRPHWESGWRGRIYALGRRSIPLAWRRALRRRIPAERLLGLRKPEIELTRFDAGSRPAAAGRADILVLPVIAWSYRRQRPQQLAEALARRGRRVFYGSLRRVRRARRARGSRARCHAAADRRRTTEDPSDRRLDGRALARALRLAGPRARGVSRSARPSCSSRARSGSPWPTPSGGGSDWSVVYDCLDAHRAFRPTAPGPGRGAERALASAADLVVATSEALRRRMAGWNAGARLLPNACDFALFAARSRPRRRTRSG